jgi:hypothetical protein
MSEALGMLEDIDNRILVFGIQIESSRSAQKIEVDDQNAPAGRSAYRVSSLNRESGSPRPGLCTGKCYDSALDPIDTADRLQKLLNPRNCSFLNRNLERRPMI